ncbi:phage coat protein [Clostridium botulinum]|nr:phage coat protein [Clostridium botulinum]NFI18012.1 phage coat protein [Clostridium botulinum]NFL92798.1 phage coat protein [Clostridium botulinum]NFN53338.1 phage coat protein [Clostridium botulinum]NFO28126.1 phage coat protein [Clostridium botulinum]
MSSIFNNKNFNGEVFRKYVESLPNLNKNELLKSGAIRSRQDIAGTFTDQVGGNYAVIPITGRIGGTPLNYDGSTDITATGIGTYTQGRIVIGRSKAWVENDFSYELTKKNFMDEIAKQIGEYWDDVDFATIISTLKGIFAMIGNKNLEFVNGHTLDISDKADGSGVFGATTLNNGMQKALGDRKAKFTMAFMHSAIATNLENLKLLEYMKYTDAQGIERSLTIATLNGRAVLIDDNMPTEEVAESGSGKGDGYTKYTSYVMGEGAIEYTDCGAKTAYEPYREPLKDGGKDYLIGRQRKIFSPYGISFKNTGIISPTDAQLEAGSNWELANDNASSSKEYISHRLIPIARVITRG